MCARLENWELYVLQLCAATLFRQHLEVIVVSLSQAEGVLPRALAATTVAGADVPDSAAMFSDRQIAAKGKKLLFRDAVNFLSIDRPVVLSRLHLFSTSCTFAATSVDGIGARVAGQGQNLAHLPSSAPVFLAFGLQLLVELLEKRATRVHLEDSHRVSQFRLMICPNLRSKNQYYYYLV